MIDIHCHILPGIDDGPADLAGSLAIAEKAVAGGTSTIIATPHVASHADLAAAARIPEAVDALRHELTARGIPLTLVAGAEVYPLEDLHTAIAGGAPVMLGPTRAYVLLDTPFAELPLGLADTVYALQLRGVTPILAHPERVRPVQEHPGSLESLVERGVLLQVTTSSLLGEHGAGARATAEALLRLRWVHFLASDAHSAERRGPGQRAAAEALAKWLTPDEIDTLVRRNGQRVLDGAPIPSNPRPASSDRRPWWRFGR
jgi:protein-tyrosine phosphatase